MTEHDPLKDVLDTHWRPQAGGETAFHHGLQQRRRHHRRRRVAMGTSAALLLCGGSLLWSQIATVTPPTRALLDTAPPPMEVAWNQSTESDYWGSALSTDDEPQAIPEEYDALSSFFFGDS